MDEEEEPAKVEEVTTAELLDLIGQVDNTFQQLAEVNYLKHNLKLAKRVVAAARKDSEEWRDSYHRAESKLGEYEKSKVTLEEYKKVQEELDNLKAEYNRMVNWHEIRYQNSHKVQQLAKENSKPEEKSKVLSSSEEQVKQSQKKSIRVKKKCKDVATAHSEKNESEKAQNHDIAKILADEHAKQEELRNQMMRMQIHQDQIEKENDCLRNEIEKKEKEKSSLQEQLQKEINTLSSQLQKEREEKDALQLQNNLLEDKSGNGSIQQNENVALSNMPSLMKDVNDSVEMEMIKLQSQNENICVSDSADSDTVNSILNEVTRHPILISPLPSDSDLKPQQKVLDIQIQAGESGQMCNEKSKIALHRQRKRRQVQKRRFFQKFVGLASKKFKIIMQQQKKLFQLYKRCCARNRRAYERRNNLAGQKLNQLHCGNVMKCRCNAHPVCCLKRNAERKETLKAHPSVPKRRRLSCESDVDINKATEQQKLAEIRRQKLLEDVPKWNTDHYLTYPSCESDFESDRSATKRKKLRKPRTKPHTSANGRDLMIKEDKACQTDDDPKTLAKADDTDIYAKQQGSVDSGYCKTDNESNVPETPESITQKLNLGFGSNSIETSKTKCMERAEHEKSVHSAESSENDLLLGFNDGCYSSVSAKKYLSFPQSTLTTTLTVEPPKGAQKSKKLTSQVQRTNEQKLNLVKNSSSCIGDKANAPNPIIDDRVGSFTCKVVQKALPIKPVIELVESSNNNCTLHQANRNNISKQEEKPSSCIMQESELVMDYVGKKRLAHTPTLVQNNSPKLDTFVNNSKPDLNLKTAKETKPPEITRVRKQNKSIMCYNNEANLLSSGNERGISSRSYYTSDETSAGGTKRRTSARIAEKITKLESRTNTDVETCKQSSTEGEDRSRRQKTAGRRVKSKHEVDTSDKDHARGKQTSTNDENKNHLRGTSARLAAAKSDTHLKANEKGSETIGQVCRVSPRRTKIKSDIKEADAKRIEITNHKPQANKRTGDESETSDFRSRSLRINKASDAKKGTPANEPGGKLGSSDEKIAAQSNKASDIKKGMLINEPGSKLGSSDEKFAAQDDKRKTDDESETSDYRRRSLRISKASDVKKGMPTNEPGSKLSSSDEKFVAQDDKRKTDDESETPDFRRRSLRIGRKASDVKTGMPTNQPGSKLSSSDEKFVDQGKVRRTSHRKSGSMCCEMSQVTPQKLPSTPKVGVVKSDTEGEESPVKNQVCRASTRIRERINSESSEEEGRIMETSLTISDIEKIIGASTKQKTNEVCTFTARKSGTNKEELETEEAKLDRPTSNSEKLKVCNSISVEMNQVESELVPEEPQMKLNELKPDNRLELQNSGRAKISQEELTMVCEEAQTEPKPDNRKLEFNSDSRTGMNQKVLERVFERAPMKLAEPKSDGEKPANETGTCDISSSENETHREDPKPAAKLPSMKNLFGSDDSSDENVRQQMKRFLFGSENESSSTEDGNFAFSADERKTDKHELSANCTSSSEASGMSSAELRTNKSKSVMTSKKYATKNSTREMSGTKLGNCKLSDQQIKTYSNKRKAASARPGTDATKHKKLVHENLETKKEKNETRVVETEKFRLTKEKSVINGFTNEQLLARRKMAKALKSKSVDNDTKPTSFKRPNKTKAKMESATLTKSDSNSLLNQKNLPSDDHLEEFGFSLDSCFRSLTIPQNPILRDSHNDVPIVLSNADPKLHIDVNSNNDDLDSPLSPEPEIHEENFFVQELKFIPLERVKTSKNELKMKQKNQQKHLAMLRDTLKQLVHFPKSAGMAQAVTREFLHEDPHVTVHLVLEVVSEDIHDSVKRFNYRRAPLLTTIQRVMLGFLLELEEKGVRNLINIFVMKAEKLLLAMDNPINILPIARIHAAICKLYFKYSRMRFMLVRALALMGDVAIPYFYIVICSWLELIPMNSSDLSGVGALQVRAVIQIVRLKTCKQPGYNLHNLLTLLCKYHGYSFDREDSEKLLEELFKSYIAQKSNTIMYLTIALCLNIDKECVFKQVDKLKVHLVVAENSEQMCAIVKLVSTITSQFSRDDTIVDDVNSNIQWLEQLCVDSYPEPVRNIATKMLRLLTKE